MHLSRSLLVVLLLVLSSTVWAGDVSHGSLTPIKDREFQILGARWGVGHRWADVTERACELATEVGLDVAAQRVHFGDPYPHFKKALVVFYLWRGELRSATAHENSRLVIPVRDEKAAAEAIWKAVKKRVAKIAVRITAGQKTANDLIDKAAASGSIDALRRAMKKRNKLAKTLSKELAPQFAELKSFFDRHSTWKKDPGFDDAWMQAAGVQIDFDRWVERSAAAHEGMREATVQVGSTSDWRDLSVKARKGDLVVFEAKGSWKLGKYAGSCGATGLSGERYVAHSPISELPHGCLLVRVGSNHFGAGVATGSTHATEDQVRVEARCNDTSYRDNSGSITVRVLVIPAMR